jgi:hypothetical protein
MKIPPIYILSSWSPGKGRIRKHLFMRGLIQFGKERSCHIREGFETDLFAIVDLTKEQAFFLETQNHQSFHEGELLEIGSSVYSWKRFVLWRSKVFWSVVMSAFAAGFLIPGGSSQLASSCQKSLDQWDGRSKRAPGEEKLRAQVQNVRRSLRKQNLIVSRSEIEILKLVLQESSWRGTCGVEELVRPLENRWSELFFLDHVKTGRYAEALGLWYKLKSQNTYEISDKFKSELSRLGMRLSLELLKRGRSHRLKPEDLNRQAFLAELCESLGKTEECFLDLLRNKIRQAQAKEGESGPKASSHIPDELSGG